MTQKEALNRIAVILNNNADAPRFAARQCSTNNANKICKEIQTLCGCTAQEAVKTLIATFDVALKMRESINS